MKYLALILSVLIAVSCGRINPNPDPLPPVPPLPPIIEPPPVKTEFSANGVSIRIEGSLKPGARVTVEQVEAALKKAIEELEKP